MKTYAHIPTVEEEPVIAAEFLRRRAGGAASITILKDLCERYDAQQLSISLAVRNGQNRVEA